MKSKGVVEVLGLLKQSVSNQEHEHGFIPVWLIEDRSFFFYIRFLKLHTIISFLFLFRMSFNFMICDTWNFDF
ncbi:hypothetical protein Hanom_Chr03g00253991 [Helianthus anomalus]